MPHCHTTAYLVPTSLAQTFVGAFRETPSGLAEGNTVADDLHDLLVSADLGCESYRRIVP